jgi:hypothetical protein
MGVKEKFPPFLPAKRPFSLPERKKLVIDLHLLFYVLMIIIPMGVRPSSLPVIPSL